MQTDVKESKERVAELEARGASRWCSPSTLLALAVGTPISQLTTVALRNPDKHASAAHLRMLGIGSLSDSREGALKVISESNMKQIRAVIRLDQTGTTICP